MLQSQDCVRFVHTLEVLRSLGVISFEKCRASGRGVQNISANHLLPKRGREVVPRSMRGDIDLWLVSGNTCIFA